MREEFWGRGRARREGRTSSWCLWTGGAAEQLDHTRHSAATLEKAALVRLLRDEGRLPWKGIAERVGVGETTAIYLYGCNQP